MMPDSILVNLIQKNIDTLEKQKFQKDLDAAGLKEIDEKLKGYRKMLEGLEKG